MPSNKKLIETIKSLVEDLGIEIDDEYKSYTNAQLSELVSDLRGKLKDQETETIADEAVEDEAVEDEAVEDEAVEDEAVEDEAVEDEAVEDEAVEDEAAEAVYVIAKGKSLICKKGLLNEGDCVKPEYLPGGHEQYLRLIDIDFLVESK